MAITNFIPKIWSSGLLGQFHVSEVIAPTVNREYEGEARSGNQVNITSITTPSVQNYKTTRTLTIDALSDTTTPLLIDQEKAISFKVDDVDRVQAAGSFEPVTRDAAAALVEDSEKYILAQMAANGTSNATTAVTNYDEAFVAIRGLRQALVVNKVPTAGRYLAVNPDFAAFLLGPDSSLVKVDQAGSDGELRNGVLGRLLGFTVIETPLLGTAGKAAAVAYHTSSVAYVNQIEKVEAGRMELAFADYVRLLHVYGAKVIRPAAVQTHIVP